MCLQRFYYNYNSGLEPQTRIFKASREEIDAVEQGTLSKPPGEVFFDCNKLSEDATVALSLLSFSHSGKYLAYGISKSGSDWFKIYFRSTTKPFAPGDSKEIPDADKGGKDRLDDELKFIKFSGASWTHDDAGLFYQRFPEPSNSTQSLGSETDPNAEARLFYHKLGEKQSEDGLIAGVDPEVRTGMYSTEVTDDGRFLILSNSYSTDPKMRQYIAQLNEDGSLPDKLKWVSVADKFESALDYLASDGNVFYFMTNKNAPRYRIVKVTIDPSKGEATQEPWTVKVDSSVQMEELIPEDQNGASLSSATVIDDDKLLLVYSRNVVDELWLFDLHSGKRLTRLMSDLVGSISQISGKRGDHDAFVSSTSFTSPGTITRLSWTGGKPQEQPRVKLHRATSVKSINPEDFVSEQRWFESKDGTK